MSIGHRRLLMLLAAAAVIVGIFVRFKGLGTWPFGADEYYLSQSVQNILRSGLPEYPCGGFYVRGIVLQYLAAGLQLLGLSPELAPRAIAAAFSLAALPAAYLLARRLGGVKAGLLAVALLSLSVWEVEMARFGRMYAPFQAVFLWYSVCFLRYTVDRQAGALCGMVLLTVLGVLTWEGGFLLIALNLLPPFINHERGRLTAAQWRYLGLMALAMLPVFLYWTGTADIRMAADDPALPPDFDELTSQSLSDLAVDQAPLWALHVDEFRMWVLALVPVALAGMALPWIWSLRQRWLAASGLLVALAAAAAHQFLVFIAVLALLLLLRLVDWRELVNRRAFRFGLAIACLATFWVLFGLLTDAWREGDSQSLRSLIVTLAYEFAGFPDFIEMIARPWARAVPWLGLSLLLMLGISAVRVVAKDDASTVERILLIVAVVMLLLVSAQDTPRYETRYSFFFYPLLLVIAIAVLVRWTEHIAWRLPGASLLGTAAVLSWFALTEDFQPLHLLRIDSADVNFRRHMSTGRSSHYYNRSNIRATADWLKAHAHRPDDLVISGPGVTALDAYFPRLDLVYVEPSDQRLYAWSCKQGTVERWSNLPLVYGLPELESRISAHPRTYIAVAAKRVEDLLADLRQFNPRIVWVNDYGLDVIVQIDRSGGS